MLHSNKNRLIPKVRQICANLSSLNDEEIGRLESILPNFQFICDLLATDVMIYTKDKTSKDFLLVDIKRPHGHPTLFLETAIGNIVEASTEPFVKKSFISGNKEVGVQGVIISGRPTQQVVYPIYHYDKIIAVLVFEKDLYLTESLLGKYWNKVADDLIGALNQKRHRLRHWPVLTGQEGFILTDNEDNIIYSSYMANNLLVTILGIRERGVNRKFTSTLKDFHPEEIEAQPVINLIKNRYIGIGGTLQITSFDLSEHNRIHVLRDVSELFLKEKELKVKGALVKEIHHRVKNNLHAVAALLRMQMRRSEDKAVKEAFTEAILRLDSITLVHEFLSQVDNVQYVEIGQIVKDIARNLQHTLNSEDKNISIIINTPQEFHLYSEQAVSLSLIVNELISNCYEHAFVGKNEGKIIVDLIAEESEFILSVKDNGIGLPKDFNLDNLKGLGWHIIKTLAEEDLNGKITVNKIHTNDFTGTEIKIEAPLEFDKKR